MKSYILFLLLICLQDFVFVSADDNEIQSEWKGMWFPENPYDESAKVDDCQSICDNGQNCLQTDLDENKHMALWNCEDNRTLYESSFDVNPIYTEFDIPTAYEPRSVCMNESIYYGEDLTAFGDYRPVWAKYGEYTYLPSQRYMHNLHLGAIVGLFHPCANRAQIQIFKSIISSCLYRHLITPSRMLTKERPFALLAWGKIFEMSVVEADLAREFIQNEALRTAQNLSDDGSYDRLLIDAANYVTDTKDSELCPRN